jgi:hypothetical protein
MASARPVHLGPRESRGMIGLGPIVGLREHRHELHAHCLACDCWAGVVELDRMDSSTLKRTARRMAGLLDADRSGRSVRFASPTQAETGEAEAEKSERTRLRN